VFRLEPGVISLIPPGANVSLACPERLVKYWCRFGARIFSSKLDLFSLGDDCLCVTPQNTAETAALFARLVSAFNDKRSGLGRIKRLEAKSALLLLLSPFIETVVPRLTGNGRRPRSVLKIAQIVAHIENNISRQFSLRELADIAGINPNYASNLFKSALGEPLGSYCAGLRVKRAAELLRNSSISIAGAAERVGVRDLSNFSKIFKARTGFSPMAYKKAWLDDDTGMSPLL
jgi:AraC-like DNA-binding protein